MELYTFRNKIIKWGDLIWHDRRNDAEVNMIVNCTYVSLLESPKRQSKVTYTFTVTEFLSYLFIHI
jgi:hypothetical protein